MNEIKKDLLALFLFVAILAGGAALSFQTVRQKYDQKIASDQISILQNQVNQLSKKIKSVSDEQQLAEQEVQNRQVIHEKSQDELLTDAVAKVTPAVVSIVISKDVPNLQVVYENPFGDDPFFKDFGFKVPTYRQNGTTHQKVGAGTGFIISSDGYILTNRHVVADKSADYTALLSDGKQLPVQVIYIDSEIDVAIAKISGKFNSISFGNSDALQLGQSVIAIGNALGEYNNSVSVGIVSGLNRQITASDNSGGSETLNGVIQTDAAINPGNSGGPLLDLNGRVVGVNVATVTGSSNISFSIPINIVKTIIKREIGR